MVKLLGGIFLFLFITFVRWCGKITIDTYAIVAFICIITILFGLDDIFFLKKEK